MADVRHTFPEGDSLVVHRKTRHEAIRVNPDTGKSKVVMVYEVTWILPSGEQKEMLAEEEHLFTLGVLS